MRTTGILRTWNDDRGFGFIAPTQGGAELFVHVSAFPRDGTRPTVGETLSFERAPGRDGKAQAVNVVRGAVGSDRPPSRDRQGARAAARDTSWLQRALVLLAAAALLLAAATWGYRRYEAATNRRHLEALPPAAAAPEATSSAAPATFRCDGRTHCSQMTSCAEATWFINHCPGTKMDGNHDGVPCEQQWCTAGNAR